MSAAEEEVMDSSALSEEEVEDLQEAAAREDQTGPNRLSSKIPAVGDIIEGKRAKKTVERLDLQAPKPKEKLKIGDGSGDKLGDIPRTNHQITRMKPAELKLLHMLLFDRPGKVATIKKNLRLFNGFPFDADSEHYNKKREKLLKNSNFTNTKLKVVCTVLDLEKKGTHSDLIDRILAFLMSPKNSGKRVPVKKKRKSKKKLSGDDSKAKTKKSKPKARSSSSSPKKSKSGSKSKAIVMDSSSDDDDEEDDEKAGASVEVEGSDGEEKPSKRKEEEEGSEGSEESSDDEESSRSSSGRGKKKGPAKRQRTPTKKTGPPKKRMKETSEKSDGDSGSEKDKKKKPAAKTKKADSSSSSRNQANAADSSDEDEPLIRMIKRAPSDEQLKVTVQSLLKDADLEEMTMKQICQKVFDTYPEHDLSSRKDFIKQTVKSIIT